MRNTGLCILGMGLCILMVAGCGTSRPSRFYLLTPLSPPETPGEAPKQDLSLIVGPITVAKYLERPGIVTRLEGNEIHFSEFDRWGEPLQDVLGRVLSENLSILLSTDRVSLFPWKGADPMDFQITLDVSRFDGEPGGDARLHARWAILDQKGMKALLIRRSSFREPMDPGGGIQSFVAAQNRMVEALSREIAAAVRGLLK